jgi:hypothetical protein
MKKSKNNSGAKILAVGAGAVALAAAGYYLFGPNAQKNRKNIKGWMIKMKGEIVEKLEMAKEISEPIYQQIVDAAAAKYLTAGSIAKEDVQRLAGELKKQWKSISGKKVIKKKAKQSVKKAVKKSKKK